MNFRRGYGAIIRAGGWPPPPTPPGAWMSNPELVAQLSHFAWGAFVVLALGLHVGPLWPFLAGAAVAAVKELWLDTQYEWDSWAGSALDFLCYLLGGAAGWLAWYCR